MADINQETYFFLIDCLLMLLHFPFQFVFFFPDDQMDSGGQQREKQKEFKDRHPAWFKQYPKFSKALANVLGPSDEILPAATEAQIDKQEELLKFIFPDKVREFFLLSAGINVSTGVTIMLSGMFRMTIHGEQYCVLGEFWKEADGDQLLLRTGDETIWYYAHD